jgi:hypothetical protein
MRTPASCRKLVLMEPDCMSIKPSAYGHVPAQPVLTSHWKRGWAFLGNGRAQVASNLL